MKELMPAFFDNRRRDLERLRQETRAFEDQGLFDPGSTELVEANLRAAESLEAAVTGADMPRLMRLIALSTVAALVWLPLVAGPTLDVEGSASGR